MGIKDRIKELEGRGDEFDEFKYRISLLECTKEFIKSFIGEDFYKDIAVDTKERIREIKNLSSAKTILFLFTKKAKEQGLQAELYDLEDRIVDWMCFNADSSENYFSIELFKRIILIALDDSKQSDKKEIEEILTIIRNGNEKKNKLMNKELNKQEIEEMKQKKSSNMSEKEKSPAENERYQKENKYWFLREGDFRVHREPA